MGKTKVTLDTNALVSAFGWRGNPHRVLDMAVNPANSLAYSILEILPSMGLFVVGYGQLLVETPRKVAARMELGQDKFLASLTLFILFSAIAQFLSWSLYGKPGYFLAEADIIQWFAVPVGAVVIAISKRKTRTNRLVPNGRAF